MTDVAAVLANLHRPRLLIRAARFGLAEYRRDRDLARIMSATSPPAPREAVDRLIAEEARLEESRQLGGATYSASRHVDLLVALMAEARALTAPGHRRSA